VDLLLELLEIVPIVLTSVGVVLLFQVTRHQRDDQARLIRELEAARSGPALAGRGKSASYWPRSGDRDPIRPLEPDRGRARISAPAVEGVES
jgi:hypothetical protein